MIVVAVGFAVFAAREDTFPTDGHSNIPFDTTNPAEVARRSDSVFVGRVIEERSTIRRAVSKTDDRKLPETQYDVEVVHLIKGELAGRVVVNAVFLGGPHFEDDAGALQLGREYLFATKVDGPWQTASRPYRRVPITSPEHRAQLVHAYTTATASQVASAP
ncbi:MAG TPA: hypothetical protein VF230_11025 [Acidimicrobiales bacterium]